MKIIIKKTKVEEVEKEISLPYFSKDGNCYFAILSEKRAIRVYLLEDEGAMLSASIHYSDWIAEASKGEKITSKEFEDMFVKASDNLADHFESMRDTIREKKNEIYDNVIIGGEGDE